MKSTYDEAMSLIRNIVADHPVGRDQVRLERLLDVVNEQYNQLREIAKRYGYGPVEK